jgi:hypothetical protein
MYAGRALGLSTHKSEFLLLGFASTNQPGKTTTGFTGIFLPVES